MAEQQGDVGLDEEQPLSERTREFLEAHRSGAEPVNTDPEIMQLLF